MSVWFALFCSDRGSSWTYRADLSGHRSQKVTGQVIEREVHRDSYPQGTADSHAVGQVPVDLQMASQFRRISERHRKFSYGGPIPGRLPTGTADNRAVDQFSGRILMALQRPVRWAKFRRNPERHRWLSCGGPEDSRLLPRGRAGGK